LPPVILTDNFYKAHILTKSIHYSLLKLLTGLAIAAFIGLKARCKNATNNIDAPLAANIHQLIGVWSAKSSIHLLIAHQAIGVTIIKASVGISC